MATDPAGEARTAFLQRYAADLERGRVQDLAAYQALFPGFEREVAEEYACLEDEGPKSGPVAAPPTETGRRHLGKYLLERELGRGGQAVVYLAEDVALGRPVALKVLRAGTIEFVSPDDLRRFRREAEVSARLEHPAICSVYEAGEAEGVPYIAMRYVRGTTLAQSIAACRAGELASRSAALPPGTSTTDTTGSARRGEFDALLRLFELCARALHFAHEHGLVHRDVKPGNVMVTEQGDPVLLDFGLARVEAEEHSLTASGVVFGTPYYMAPEQVRGEARAVDRRTDVYALGISLYEALTLQRPFEAPSREALYRQILLHEPRPVRALNPRVPRDLQVVVETAMAKEPARRYQTALDLAEDLRRVRQREPIVARAAGPLLRAWRFAQRRPAVALLLAALAASLATGAALLTASNRLLSAKVGEFTRLADLRHVGLLEQELDRLPAVLPAHEPELRRWLEDARRVHGRLALHRRTRERLAADTEEDPVARQWHLDALADLIARLERFAGHRIPLAERRLEHVRSVARRTLEDASEAWRAALAAIADPVRAPLYRGLRIEPQIGLVPLGPDPDSGLHEFAHLASGEVPRRNPDGRLDRSARGGIVLVLLPGGTFTMGATLPDTAHPAGSPNVDPQCLPAERPPHPVTLAPFFIAKHELTQGQWQHCKGENPSQLRPNHPQGDQDFSDLHPVDTVSHRTARELFAVLGLVLPTEAQWEYAARAGTAFPWWTGDAPHEVVRGGNVLDVSGLRAVPEPLPADSVERRVDDGFALTAPVGSFAPNAFGLHDTIGNIGELVLCEQLRYENPVRPGDGLRLDPEARVRDPRRVILRGGGALYPISAARSSARHSVTEDTTAAEIGVRAARALDPR